jgi:1,4-dihydroxy-6-naphthoate synthase
LELTLGFSPCPNDTFIFDALVHQKINTKGYTFNFSMDDVETLNQYALQGKLDITKMSFAASCYTQQKYYLLQSGAALGKGVGPLLISKMPIDLSQLNTIKNVQIALPGEKTTAHFLCKYFAPHLNNKIFIPFNEIEDWVLHNDEEYKRLGVIIHENRFTYQTKGLHLVQDLGAYWEQKTTLPIPLGGIFIKSSFSQKIKAEIDALIKESLEYAFKNYTTELPSFVKNNAQEMSENVMWQHIKLYVNEYSLQLNEEALQAIELMKKLITLH